jgi:hypothetical protein
VILSFHTHHFPIIKGTWVNLLEAQPQASNSWEQGLVNDKSIPKLKKEEMKEKKKESWLCWRTTAIGLENNNKIFYC